MRRHSLTPGWLRMEQREADLRKRTLISEDLQRPLASMAGLVASNMSDPVVHRVFSAAKEQLVDDAMPQPMVQFANEKIRASESSMHNTLREGLTASVDWKTRRLRKYKMHRLLTHSSWSTFWQHPYHRVRAHVLYTLHPAEETFWGKARSPLYWAILAWYKAWHQQRAMVDVDAPPFPQIATKGNGEQKRKHGEPNIEQQRTPLEWAGWGLHAMHCICHECMCHAWHAWQDAAHHSHWRRRANSY